jgi:hypothetical protein
MMGTVYTKILACILVVVFPLTMFAADTPSAMLYSHGTALLNGNPITRSSAIFLGDLVQTNPDSVVNITATGSIVMVLNDSLVQYEGTRIKLEHGGVNVSTSKLLAARAGLVTVEPASGVLTEFEVRDVDGIVRIAAWKGDLTIRDPKGITTLAQGQQAARDEGARQDDSQDQTTGKKKRKKPAAVIAPTATGGILNSPVAVGVAGGIVLGGAIWVLSMPDEPASPAKP